MISPSAGRAALHHLCLPAAIALGLVLASSTGAEAAAKKRANLCQPAGAKTVIASSSARLYTRRQRKSIPAREEPDRSRVTNLYGCSAGKRPVRLASAGSYSAGTLSFGTPQLAGRYAGVTSSSDDRGGFSQTLEVYDLARRRLAFRISPPDGGRFGDFVLARSGNAAWIQNAPSPGQDPDAMPALNSFQVGARVGGRSAILDSGPGIGFTSLAASGPILYWTNGGRAVTGRLP